MKLFGHGGGGHGIYHVFIRGGYCKMTQIDTGGEVGSKIVHTINTYFLNGPLEQLRQAKLRNGKFFLVLSVQVKHN
jgi:hypothetical protein